MRPLDSTLSLVEKLIPNLRSKKKICSADKDVKQALDLELVLKTIHRGIDFFHSEWFSKDCSIEAMFSEDKSEYDQTCLRWDVHSRYIKDSDVWYTFQIHQSEIRRDSPASDDWHQFSCICPSLPVGCNKKVRGTSRSKVSPLKSLSSWDSEATCMFLTIMIKLRKKLCKGIKKLTLTIKPRQLIQNLILWSHRPDTHVSLSMIFFELTQRLDENTRTQHHTLNWESLIQQSDPNWWHCTKEC